MTCDWQEELEELRQMLQEGVERCNTELTRRHTAAKEGELCVICCDKKKNVVLLPCKHLCICESCEEGLKQQPKPSCPMCRCLIKDTMCVYGT